MHISDDAVRALVYRSCLALDQDDYAGYLALCTEEMRYQITYYSPEIGKDVILMNQNKAGLAALFETLPDHIKLPGELMRHASVYEVARTPGGTVAEVAITVADAHNHAAATAIKAAEAAAGFVANDG